MWLGEIIVNDSVRDYKCLLGPICRVGRKSDCDISYNCDKSVSRFHSELIFEIGSNLVYVKDLESKFHTFVNNLECSPNKKYAVTSDDVIIFGALGSKLRFRKLIIRICATRLEKGEKEKLKLISKSIEATVVKNVGECTHLVCNKFSATIKVLEALVSSKPIVTMEWLQYMHQNRESRSSSFPFPDPTK